MSAMVGPTHDVVIVGAGFAGIGLAHQLRQAGVQDVVMFERGDTIGGTWRDNTYPGVACDVPTPLYSYSFALEPLRRDPSGPGWSGLYAPQREILAYLERCVDRFGLRPSIRFGVDVERAVWDDHTRRWSITYRTASGASSLTAKALVSASGHALRIPVTPRFDGGASFAGRQMHTARWDDSIDLAGLRVAVVGTGASAAQVIPAIAPRVAHLSVFQRTAGWVLPRLDPEGRLFRQLQRLPGGTRLSRWCLYWAMEGIAIGHVFEPRLHERFTEPHALRHLHAQVADPILREKLTPRFRLGCKRMIISNDLYPALSRPSVSVITDSITRIEPSGIRTADATLHDVDVIIYATGYEAAEGPVPFDITGRAGRRLEEDWREGSEAHRGTTITGFPNLFLMVGPNLGQGHTSMIFMMESQFPYVVTAIRQLLTPGGPRSLDVRSDAQAAWNDFIQRRLARTVWNSGGCTSWYLTRAGKNTTAWPGFTWEYWLRMHRFDRESYHAD